MDKGFDPSYDDNKKEDIIYMGKERQKEGSEEKFRNMEILTSQNGTLLTAKNKEKNSTAIDFNILIEKLYF